MVWLRNKGVAAQHDTVEFVHIRVAACHKDDRHLGEGANLSAEGKSAGSRQFDVQQNQVRLFRLDLVNYIVKILRRGCFIAVTL